MNKCYFDLSQEQSGKTDDYIKKGAFEKKDLFFIAGIIGVYFLFRMIPYSSSLSYLLQISIAASSIILYLQKPIMTFPVILILNVLPNQIFYATNSEFANHYQLNSTMVLIMLGIMFAYKLFVCKKGKLVVGMNSTYLFPMVFLMAISVVGAVQPAYYSLDFYMLLLIYIAIPFFMESENDVNIVWLSFCLCGTLFSFALFSNLNTFGNIYEMAVMADRNYLAMFGVISLMFLINFVSAKHKSKYRVLSIGAIVVSAIIAWLIFSFASRTAFILMILFIALQLMTTFGNNKKAAFIITVGTAILIWLVYNSEVASFLFARFQMASATTGNGRYTIAAEFLSGFWDSNILRKLMGYGLNGYLVTGHVAHNVYLGVLLDFGVLCFILLMIVLVKITYYLWRSKYRLFLVSFLIFLVYMGTLDAHTDPAGACFLSAMAGIADVGKKDLYRIKLGELEI